MIWILVAILAFETSCPVVGWIAAVMAVITGVVRAVQAGYEIGRG